jgi:hypothetical protein
VVNKLVAIVLHSPYQVTILSRPGAGHAKRSSNVIPLESPQNRGSVTTIGTRVKGESHGMHAGAAVIYDQCRRRRYK